MEKKSPCFDAAIENDMIIIGGYFTLTRRNSSINLGTFSFLEIAAQYDFSLRELCKDLFFGIPINDIGSVCKMLLRTFSSKIHLHYAFIKK